MWDFLTVPALAVPYRSSLFVFPIIYIYIIYSVGHYPNTALKTQKKIFFEQGSGLSSLGRLMCRTTSFVSLLSLCPPVFGKSDAPSTAHGARSAAATELRRSRCCDGVAAATDMRRPAHSRSFCASRRADAAATELMLRAALLRRSCDGVAAATESLL